jgi:broad specificity phosphatase PhoE
MTMTEARARWPDARDLRMHTQMLPGAETGAEFYARARSFLDELEAGSALPILVTHGGTIRMLTAAWLRMSDDALDYAHFASHPTGITVLLSWGEGGRERMVERANDLGHLSGADGWVPLKDVLS